MWMVGLMFEKTDHSWSWRQFIWAVSVVLVLPNAVMLLFTFIYGLERPYINADYAIVMLLFIVNQRILGVIVLLAAFFFDILALVGQVFPVLRIADIPYMAKFIGVAPLGYKVSAVILSLLSVGLIFAFLYKNSQKSKLEFLFCINVVIMTYGISAIFLGEEETRIWSNKERSFVSSQAIFGIDSRRTGFVESLFVDGDLFSDITLNGATEPWFVDIAGLDEKVLLIVNESWGVSNQKVQSAVMSPLLEANNKIADWQEGSLSFNGITIEAEIRELCQSDLLHFNFEGHEEELAGCIPNQLRKQGYKTVAFHGAAGLMYDRARWYPQIGFDKQTFFESYSWPSRCYSFPGACDVDMADHVADSYATEGKVFGYWLTLNTHHLYDLRDLSFEVLQCENIGVRAGTETCRNLKLQHQFFIRLSEIVTLPHMSGVRVVVVSDHEPRISNQAQMDEYFEKGRVPWVSFRVK